MSAEHLWLQVALLNICLDLGYEASLETDYADVRVGSSPPLAIEVQKHGTEFEDRAKQRKQRGMRTLWVFPDSAKKAVDDPLFSLPAVRARYIRHASAALASWDPQNTSPIDLQFGATIWKQGSTATQLEPAGNKTPRDFLYEVLEGVRVWHPATALHERSDPRQTWAGWALKSDLDEVRQARDARDTQAAAEHAARRRKQAALDLAHEQALREDEARDRRRAREEASLSPAPIHEETTAMLSSDDRVEQGAAPQALHPHHESATAERPEPEPSNVRPGFLRRFWNFLTS